MRPAWEGNGLSLSTTPVPSWNTMGDQVVWDERKGSVKRSKKLGESWSCMRVSKCPIVRLC